MANDINEHEMKQAWELFRQGNLLAAEKAATDSMQKAPFAESPLADILIVKAFYLCRLGHSEEARNLFANIMKQHPHDPYVQAGYILSLKDKLGLNTKTKLESQRSPQLLIGLGTGRSGSTTLTKLWKAQPACYCSHEHPPRLPWTDTDSRYEFHKQRFLVALGGHGYVGDVSHWWLPYVEDLIASFNGVRFVVLKRDRDATVKSFLNIKKADGGDGMNHWMKHDGTVWGHVAWDECYPTYDVDKIEIAIQHYWQDYYDTVDALIARYPAHIRQFKTEDIGR
ncbi:MAG TPA: tetratricopeptide repeat protein, partial [Flavobacteriales bacterium]|nr:tetratricopeptide repeat protein [Flavobacteriales bacterium]